MRLCPNRDLHRPSLIFRNAPPDVGTASGQRLQQKYDKREHDFMNAQVGPDLNWAEIIFPLQVWLGFVGKHHTSAPARAVVSFNLKRGTSFNNGRSLLTSGTPYFADCRFGPEQGPFSFFEAQVMGPCGRRDTPES